MTYPLSNEVVVGDATEASQYNNLRRDALYLGGEPGHSGNLMQLLSRVTGAISLTRASGTTIQLTASASNPCGVTIGGAIYAVTSNVSVMVLTSLLPTAGRYGIWAVGQTDGTFTLAAGSAGPDNSAQIGTFLWDGSGVIPGTVRSIMQYESIQTLNIPQTANGRLTFLSGTPVPDGNITSADTLYFTPYGGNKIGLMCGGGEWEIFTFPELSLSLSGLTNELPYDVFIDANQNGLRLTASPWGSVSARATAIAYTDGVPVMASDFRKRYLGTFAKNSAGYGEDSLTGRLLWNQNNRVGRALLSRLEEQASGATSSNQWRPYYSDEAAPVVRALIPMADAAFELTGLGLSEYISAENAGYSRFYMMGISRDPVMESPYTGNTNCAPVFMRCFGNTPQTVTIRNHDAGFLGLHKYVLTYYSNYTYKPQGGYALTGEAPGLYGEIMG